MKYSQAGLGRVFILRLEQGDQLPNVIEDFARTHQISSALVLFLGGADAGSKIVTGPEDGNARPPVPMVTDIPGVSEALGVGTIFAGAGQTPKLHMHAAFGRGEEARAGCTRAGVATWQIGEVIILELVGTSARREVHPETGFELLEV
ncbi:MAG: DNA-binding protein [Clostridia bacterium]|nr:DNA-binding protein [Clostridia bacterium]